MRRHLHVVREGPERPPFVLRWIWFFAPLLVAGAMVGMVLAARSAREAPPVEAALEAYAERAGHVFRVADGARLRRGEALHFVVAPAHAKFVTVSTSTGQVARLGPLPDDALRADVPEVMPVTTPGHLRVTAVFDSDRTVSLAFDVE